MSGMTNGIFWVGQQTQLNQFARADRNLAWTHIALLCAIPLTPHGSAGGSLAEKVRRFTLPSAFDFYVRSYNMGAVLR
jgi:uncharacterized membrane protein